MPSSLEEVLAKIKCPPQPPHVKLRQPHITAKEHRSEISTRLSQKGIPNVRDVVREQKKATVELSFENQQKLQAWEKRAGTNIHTDLQRQALRTRLLGATNEHWTSSQPISLEFRDPSDLTRICLHPMDMRTRLCSGLPRQMDIFDNRYFVPTEKAFLTYVNSRFKENSKPPHLEPVLHSSLLHLLQAYMNIIATFRMTIDTWLDKKLEIDEEIIQDLEMLRRCEHETNPILQNTKSLMSAATYGHRYGLLRTLDMLPINSKSWSDFGENMTYDTGVHPFLNTSAHESRCKRFFGANLLRPQTSAPPQFTPSGTKAPPKSTPRKRSRSRERNRSRSRGRNYRSRRKGRQDWRERRKGGNYGNDPAFGKKKSGIWCWSAADNKGSCRKQGHCVHCDRDKKEGNKFEYKHSDKSFSSTPAQSGGPASY